MAFLVSDKELIRIQSPYQLIVVGEQHGVRYLRFGGESAGWQGAMVVASPKRLYFPYQQAFSFYEAFVPEVSNFLSIGVGTGTSLSHVHERHPKASLLGIEWDPRVLEVARNYFSLPDDRITLIEADARIVLPKMHERFDLIFLDAYYRDKTPKTFYSPLYLKVLADRLETDGVLAINMITVTQGSRSKPFVELCAWLTELIGPVFTLSLGPLAYTPHNLLLFAVKTDTLWQDIRIARQEAMHKIINHPEYYRFWSRVLPYRIHRW
nr:fused MFS/spermidine synthase [Bacilli bacterium]